MSCIASAAAELWRGVAYSQWLGVWATKVSMSSHVGKRLLRSEAECCGQTLQYGRPSRWELTSANCNPSSFRLNCASHINKKSQISIYIYIYIVAIYGSVNPNRLINALVTSGSFTLNDDTPFSRERLQTVGRWTSWSRLGLKRLVPIPGGGAAQPHVLSRSLCYT